MRCACTTPLMNAAASASVAWRVWSGHAFHMRHARAGVVQLARCGRVQNLQPLTSSARRVQVAMERPGKGCHVDRVGVDVLGAYEGGAHGGGEYDRSHGPLEPPVGREGLKLGFHYHLPGRQNEYAMAASLLQLETEAEAGPSPFPYPSPHALPGGGGLLPSPSPSPGGAWAAGRALACVSARPTRSAQAADEDAMHPQTRQ